MLLNLQPQLILTAFLTVAAQATLKKGLEIAPIALNVKALVTLFTTPLVLLGLSLQVGAMLSWFFVLGSGKFSVAFPSLLSLTMIITMLLDWMIWRQPFTPGQIIGMTLIISGLFVMNKW